MTSNSQTAPDNSRWIALVVLATGFLMIVLDGTVVNVALPSIQKDLHFSQPGLAWVVNAYLIAFGGLLLLAGRLGDLISRRGVFLAGLGLFTVASVVCGASQTQAMLVIARFVQGIGGAMASAVILGMIVTMFPDPREQAKAMGVYGFVASAGASVGLLAGGVLTQAINWHWIFFINIPIGIATVVFALRLLPHDRGIGFGDGVDVLGALLITGSLMLGVYTIVKPAAEEGWGAGATLGLGAIALALLAAFVVREATAKNPLMPLRIFRSRNVSGANGIQVLLVAGMFGLFFMGALYLQKVLGYDPLETGLAFLPATLLMGILSLGYSEKLIMRFGARTMLFPSMLLLMAGLLLFTQAPADGSYWHVLPVMLLLGAGGGTCFPALVTIAMSGATPSDAGLTSGLVNTSMQVGGALGLAVLATVSSGRSDHLRAAGHSLGSALTGGYHLAWLIGALLVAAALVIAALVIEPVTPMAHTPLDEAETEAATAYAEA